VLLDTVIGFPRAASPGSVDGETLFLLAFSDGIAVPALNAIPFLLLLRYSLTCERLSAIQSSLHKRTDV
jgi:hypothetical protein